MLDTLYNILPFLSVLFFAGTLILWLNRAEQLSKIQYKLDQLELKEKEINNSIYKSELIRKDIEEKKELLEKENVKLEIKRDEYKIFDN